MGAFFGWLGRGLSFLGGLIMPVFRKARSPGVGRGCFWVLHVLVVLLILVGLYFLNKALGLPDWLTRHPAIQYWFLDILFLLVYAIFWLGWWLWSLLVTEPDYIAFKDITEAWEEAVAALARAGMDVRDLPMFLVLGRPEGPMHGVFQAAKLQFVVQQTPAQPSAPLHLYATRDAIYVTCQGCSLLGRHAAILAGDQEGTGKSSGDINLGGGGGDGLNPEETLMAGRAKAGPDSEVEQYLKRIREEKRELTREEMRKLRGLIRKDRSYQALINNAELAAHISQRFESFCRLVVRDRWPFCPINGMLILVPFAAAELDQDAVDTGATLARDLAIARSALQVNCAKLAMVCDLETASGYSAFLGGFQEKQRQQRIGQRFPLVPVLEGLNGQVKDEADAQRVLVEGLAQSICTAVVPAWVHKHFRLETPRQNYHDALGANSQLFLFMHQFRERQRRLGQVLSRGLAAEGGEPPLFGGCYLAATGADLAREQAFVAGVFRRLTEEENSVTWTAAAEAEEAAYQRWVALGQTVLAVLVVLGLGLAGFWLFGPRK